jgi:hypothetical protein
MTTLWRTTGAHKYLLHPSASGAEDTKNQIFARCHHHKRSTRVPMEGSFAQVIKSQGCWSELDQINLSLGVINPVECLKEPEAIATLSEQTSCNEL